MKILYPKCTQTTKLLLKRLYDIYKSVIKMGSSWTSVQSFYEQYKNVPLLYVCFKLVSLFINV